MDLAEKIKGMYRLLDLINESGSNGCGNKLFSNLLLASSIKKFCYHSRQGHHRAGFSQVLHQHDMP